MRSSGVSVVSIVFAILTVAVAAVAESDSENSSTFTSLQSTLLKAPSLQLHVKLKGKNMMIHGQSEFDMFAKPVVFAENSSIHYNGFSTFSQGATTFTYAVVNGMSYMVESSPSSRTVHCLPSILPFELMLPALNNAVAIPSASVGGDLVECPNGSLFQASFSGVDFVLCSTGSGFTAYGLDVTVTAKYLSIPINTPLVPDEGIMSCPVVAPPTSMTPTAITLLTGKPLPPASRNLKAASPVAIQADRCECKSTPRPCIFLHGLGNPNEEAELQDSPELTKEKFGDIGDHAPCCSTVKYAVVNTVDAGWTNETLQQKFCDFSLSMSETSDLASRTISDTIIVTHSMGGLVIATALATGKCKLAESTSWVAISAPMMGSMAGDYIQDLCDDENTSLGADLLGWIGQCPASTARKLISYQGEKYSNDERNAAYKAAQEAYRSNVTAALCSKSYIGVLSKFSPAALVGGTVIPHKSDENDALVEFESCLGGLDPELFGNNYLDRFYAAKLNHADTAFLTHDGLFKDSKKPFKWFECLL